ncbi:MAG: hypothetical protein ABGZ17_17845 [Planctomycetaceae bacterium]
MKYTPLTSIVLIVTSLLLNASSVRSGEIGFAEQFVLAKDRNVPLQQLIPGTEDYFFYHCLHYQNSGQFEKVEQTLQSWVKRHKQTPRVRLIQNRQSLLTYTDNPKQTLDHLRNRLQLRFDHRRLTGNQQRDLPTALDPELIGRQRLTRDANRRYTNLQGFEDSALDWLIAEPLNPVRRRALLTRLTRPDYPQLVKRIVDDLQHPGSQGFGSLKIHGRLLLDQLEASLEATPALLNRTQFINAYLLRLQPRTGVDWRNNPPEVGGYLDRLWAFANRLSPAHNSLKAHILYHRLVFDRSRGEWNADRFMEYVKLPRQGRYLNPVFLARESSRRYPAKLNADFSASTLLPPILNDEPLVRSYLQHFFVEAPDYSAFEPYIRDSYLKRQFAETKIINGLGDPQTWYSMLQPAEFQALKERIDLDFGFTNPHVFGAEDPVALTLYLKNVTTLIVKVYEINSHSLLRKQQREVNTDINLDGLVANQEQTHTYGEPPLRRVRRQFPFPKLKRRGVYVIDFIGNGRSSRVLIRKGRLHSLMRLSSAGHVFTVLNEAHALQTKASIWMGATEYRSDKQGAIVVPYSNQPNRRPIVLTAGGVSSLNSFHHLSERYALTAGIYVNRESLLSRRKAEVVLRPTLTVNGIPVSLDLLQDVRLLLTATAHDQVRTTKEVKDFKLYEDRDSLFAFQVPRRLSALQFTLQGRIKNLGSGQDQTLSVSESFALNQIDPTEKIEDIHLGRSQGGYVLDVLGKSGERRPHRPVRVVLKHHDFRAAVNVSLQSDAGGRIQLGAIADIDSISATPGNGQTRTWKLTGDQHSYATAINARVGQPILLPYMGTADEPRRDEFSLLQLRGGSFRSDQFQGLGIDNGFLTVKGLPAGDHDLWLKRSGQRIQLHIETGPQRAHYVLGRNRLLEVQNPAPLQIASIQVQPQTIAVQLANASEFSRVHVFATRYQPPYSAFDHLNRSGARAPYQSTLPALTSHYLTGRNIGDEYRYIINRRFAIKYPGNSLERPSLLLNPWAIRQTDTAQQRAMAGDDFEAEDAQAEASQMGGRSAADSKPSVVTDFANLDFLDQGGTTLLNLAPDKNGTVTIDRAALGTQQHVQIVAIDPQNTAVRHVYLPESRPDFQDLRLLTSLDPQQHFTRQKQVTSINGGGKLVLSDITSSRFETYDSLARVYNLYATLTNDSQLAEFGFLLKWPEMTADQKRTAYSKFSCHELNFFLYQKDRQFYDDVIAAYLANKHTKQFIDLWLLKRDLSEFRSPWKHAQLNTLERILLAQRIAAERGATARHVRDRFDLLAPDQDRLSLLFTTALNSRALDRDANGKMAQLADKVTLERATQLAIERPMRKAPAGPPAAAPATNRASARQRGQEQRKLSEKKKEASAKMTGGGLAMKRKQDLFFARDGKQRGRVRQLYRQLQSTQEWVENNYYHLPIAKQTSDLIPVNAFWNALAARDPQQDFRSEHFALAAGNAHEMLMALAVLDLPFAAKPHEEQFEKTQLTLTLGSPAIVFHEQIRSARMPENKSPILVSQNFYRHGDRYRQVHNERQDKYVTEEFLTHTVYGCQIVATNPSSSAQKLDLLLQIPRGAIPVLNSHYTRGMQLRLEPYNTKTLDYYFYFPTAGDYTHYPIHVARDEQVVARVDAFPFNVVDKLSKLDRGSWSFVSQNGTEADVFAYLQQNNLENTALELIAFRMSDKPFFSRILSLLASRHIYNHTLWSYAVYHNDTAAIRQYLQHANAFVQRCGPQLSSPVLDIDPIARKSYEHMEYSPLVNARSHQLGRKRQVLNDRFHTQYHRLLDVLSYQPELSHQDHLSLAYYMLLQSRISEAIAHFKQIDAEHIESRMQFDYLAAYLDFFNDDPQLAPTIVEQYAGIPVDRWRKRFQAMAAQLNELKGRKNRVVDPTQINQTQTNLAATEASFDFEIDARNVVVNYQNLKQVQIKYYLMDIELLFSRSPFARHDSGQFSQIRPNVSQSVKLPGKARKHSIPLPETLHNSNVLIEVTAGGRSRSQAYYANALVVQLIDNYGQLQVTHKENGKPLPKTYVKVYARARNGQITFYKDGYTDLRGRFDYSSLSTNTLDNVERFSLLILHEELGAIVREASIPQR